MSLVIHTVVKDGFVICADSRITCKNDNGSLRYNDSAEKIFLFGDKIVVTYTGDSWITERLSVEAFLTSFQSKCGKKITVASLPVKLLNEYVRRCGNQVRDIEFKVTGCDESDELGCCTYTISCKDRTIVLSRPAFSFGASFGGMTDVAFAMMNGASYQDMSLKEAISFTQSVIVASISAYSCRAIQYVGGDIKTYVVDAGGDKCYWVDDIRC